MQLWSAVLVRVPFSHHTRYRRAIDPSFSYSAGSGIGRAVAIILARRGISYLTCGDIDLEKAEETLELAARATDPDKTLFIGRAVQVDIRSELDVEAFFSVARNLSPRIDICVNTAGVGFFFLIRPSGLRLK